MKIITLLLLSSVLATSSKADSAPPPYALNVLSKDGSKIVRVDPVTWGKIGKTRTPAKVSVYSFDSSNDSYVVLSRFDLGNELPSEFLYVTDDANYIVAANIGHWLGANVLGIRVYGTSGKLLRKWQLSDFLTEKEISNLPKTGASTRWFESGYLFGKKFTFSGPVKSSLTAMVIDRSNPQNHVIENIESGIQSYSFELDLDSLELTRR